MKLENWIETIIGTIILGTLGFFGMQLFDMKGQISSVTTKMDATESRISRIAEVLPEVKARIAWEEVNEPINGVILTSNPKELERNKWETVIKLYNAQTSQLKRYKFILKEDHKEHVSDVISGRVRRIDKDATTFSDLLEYSKEEKEPVAIPASINSNASFVVRNSNVDEVSNYLQTASGKQPEISNIEKAKNWREFIRLIDKLAREGETKNK